MKNTLFLIINERVLRAHDVGIIICWLKIRKKEIRVQFVVSGSFKSIFVKPDQFEWYDNKYSKILRKINIYNKKIDDEKNGYESELELKQLHSLWFMHRSVDEINNFFNNLFDLYSHCVKNGDVLGACFGHDHGNSFYSFTKDNFGFDSVARVYPFSWGL